MYSCTHGANYREEGQYTDYIKLHRRTLYPSFDNETELLFLLNTPSSNQSFSRSIIRCRYNRSSCVGGKESEWGREVEREVER